MRKMEVYDDDLPLSVIMSRWPQTIAVFNKHKMLCVGCLISPFHTIVDACAEYGRDEDVFVAELMEAAGL